MANKIFAIPRLDDHSVLALFREFDAKHRGPDFYLNLVGVDGVNLRAELD